MKSILMSELAPDFLIQGLGLHEDEKQTYVGKVGRQEIQLLPSEDALPRDEEEIRILTTGWAEASQQFRPGDILMAGSDDMLDRAFLALDDLDQRGVVVSLTPSQDPTHLHLSKEHMVQHVQDWKTRKVSFLCLWMVEPVELEGQAKLVTILRKVLIKD